MDLKAETFNLRKAEIIELLHKLNAQCEVLCSKNPDDLNWAQIGDMGQMVELLRGLVERT